MGEGAFPGKPDGWPGAVDNARLGAISEGGMNPRPQHPSPTLPLLQQPIRTPRNVS
jgi:hypothetical protein